MNRVTSASRSRFLMWRTTTPCSVTDSCADLWMKSWNWSPCFSSPMASRHIHMSIVLVMPSPSSSSL